MLIINESRSELAKLFTGKGAEIGVEQGVFSEIICKASFNVKLFCVDSWKSYREYRDHVRQTKLDRFYINTRRRLRGYNCKIIKKFSMDAVKDFEDNSLDFVYIDANHKYEYVLEDITEWAKKVKPGGIVSGHDYIRRKGQEHLYGVVKAVNEYIRTHQVNGFTVYRNVDNTPSWMFYKV